MNEERTHAICRCLASAFVSILEIWKTFYVLGMKWLCVLSNNTPERTLYV